MIDESDYNKIREDTQRKYSKFEAAFCPALKTDIIFSAQGFNHIIYKKGRTEREKPSQIMRFKLLERAFELVSLSTTIQEYEELVQEFSVKKKKQKILLKKKVKYWGLIAIINDRKIKVIIRKVGNGNLFFWSVVPAWVTNKTRDGKFIKTMKGDPEFD